MNEGIRAVVLQSVTVQENGIIRNSKGRLIARLCEDSATFESDHVLGISQENVEPKIQPAPLKQQTHDVIALIIKRLYENEFIDYDPENYDEIVERINAVLAQQHHA
jgi:hypothetical protein